LNNLEAIGTDAFSIAIAQAHIPSVINRVSAQSKLKAATSSMMARHAMQQTATAAATSSLLGAATTCRQ
jgi:hypothetical protein